MAVPVLSLTNPTGANRLAHAHSPRLGRLTFPYLVAVVESMVQNAAVRTHLGFGLTQEQSRLFPTSLSSLDDPLAKKEVL